MNITITRNAAIVFLIGLILIAGCAFMFLHPEKADASAPMGVTAGVATTTYTNVGPQNNVWTLLGTTTRETAKQCSARIVTTQQFPVMLSFASLSSTTLSTTIGHLQPASTTVAYDSGLFGCGYLTARGLYSSSTITVTETN